LSIEGILLKRSDSEPRYVEFFYRTGTVSFKLNKEDLKPTKVVLSKDIKDVRMMFDNPED
jgi:hypothetical protein